MPVYTIFRGNSRRIDHVVKRAGVVENLSGATLLFTAKVKDTDAYSAAQIKHSTGALGGVVVTDAAQGNASTFIVPADTISLTKRTVLEYDLELQTVLGDVETVERGQIIVEVDITDTTGPAGPPPPVAPAPTDGTFVQWQTSLTPDAYAASSWALPVTAPVGGDVGKVLAVSATGVAAFRSLAFPANPGDDGKLARASGGSLTYVAGSATNDTWVWNGTTWVPGAPKRRVLLAWGNNAINTGVAQFLQPWMSIGATDGSEIRVHVVPFDGVLRLMRLTHWTPTGTEDIVYTVRTGNAPGTMADSALALTLNAAAAAGSNLANAVSVLAGEFVSLKSNFTGTNRTLRASCSVMLEES